MDAPLSLTVFLNDTLVGAISRVPGQGDLNIFTFAQSYLDDANRPTLSLNFKGKSGEISYRPRPYNTKVHPFFANLLPEGRLRDTIAERDGVHRDRDFFLLRALGDDLPGAVIVRPAGEAAPVEAPPLTNDGPSWESGQPLKFSLAGVQLKFSAIREASGGLTIPAYGRGGDWIIKLPSERFDAVPENEYAMMRLAAHAGFTVPEIDLVSLDRIQGLPVGFRKNGHAFAIRRFDRAPIDDASGHGGVPRQVGRGTRRIHIEDFAQVFGVPPGDKYGKASYGNIAHVLWAETGEEGIRDFVGRLVFSAAIANGDMHLKNWSLLYADPRRPRLAPVYDFLSTAPYVSHTEDMALSLAGTKSFQDVSTGLFRKFADKVGIPADLAGGAALDAARRTVDAWVDLRKDLDIPVYLKEIIEKQMRSVRILQEVHPQRFASVGLAVGGVPEDRLQAHLQSHAGDWYSLAVWRDEGALRGMVAIQRPGGEKEHLPVTFQEKTDRNGAPLLQAVAERPDGSRVFVSLAADKKGAVQAVFAEKAPGKERQRIEGMGGDRGAALKPNPSTLGPGEKNRILQTLVRKLGFAAPGPGRGGIDD